MTTALQKIPGLQWSQDEAIQLCTILENIAPKYGCHVALTGGTLYKPGRRKDVDILFYRIRQTPEIDVDGLMGALEEIGIFVTDDHGWVIKAIFHAKSIDFFFPERAGSAQEYI